MRRIVVLAVALLVTSCKSKDQWDTLEEEHRPAAEAFFTKVLAVRAALPAAPTETSGWELAPGEIRASAKDGKPANTLVILDTDFTVLDAWPRHVLPRVDFRVGPRTDREMSELGYWIRAPEGYGRADWAFVQIERSVEWHRGIRYVAVIIADEVVHYTAKKTSLAGRWSGRIALYDLETSRWLGAVKLAMQGERAVISHYRWVDGRGNGTGKSGPDVTGGLNAALYKLNTSLDAAARYAIETGKSITDVSQMPKKS